MASQSLGGILSVVPLPLDDAIARPKRKEFGKGEDPLQGKITQKWVDYFTAQGATTANTTLRVASVEATAQTGSIGAVDISNGNLAPGLYDFGYYLRITTAGGAGFTVRVILDWIDGGVARSFIAAVLDGTVLANTQSDSKLIRIDGASAVRYSTVVVAGVAPTMVYALDVVLLRIDA